MRKKILVLAAGLAVWVLCPGEILAQNMTPVADAGLHFGAGNTLEAASFFSGLIDDVRIYNRAVSP